MPPRQPGPVIPDEIQRQLGSAEAAAGVAEALAAADGLVVSGRGMAYSTALDLGLKLKETCYLPALGLSYADLLHGPIAVVGADVPALLVAAGDGPMLPGMTDLARAVAARGGRAFGIGGDERFARACTASLPGPSLPEMVTPWPWSSPASSSWNPSPAASAWTPTTPAACARSLRREGQETLPASDALPTV